jgi:hypothetical protein
VTSAGQRSTKSLRQRVDPLGERKIQFRQPAFAVSR